MSIEFFASRGGALLLIAASLALSVGDLHAGFISSVTGSIPTIQELPGSDEMQANDVETKSELNLSSELHVSRGAPEVASEIVQSLEETGHEAGFAGMIDGPGLSGRRRSTSGSGAGRGGNGGSGSGSGASPGISPSSPPTEIAPPQAAPESAPSPPNNFASTTIATSTSSNTSTKSTEKSGSTSNPDAVTLASASSEEEPASERDVVAIVAPESFAATPSDPSDLPISPPTPPSGSVPTSDDVPSLPPEAAPIYALETNPTLDPPKGLQPVILIENPEPSTGTLFAAGLGMLSLALVRSRRRASR